MSGHCPAPHNKNKLVLLGLKRRLLARETREARETAYCLHGPDAHQFCVRNCASISIDYMFSISSSSAHLRQSCKSIYQEARVRRTWVYLGGAGGCHAGTREILDHHHYHHYDEPDHLPLIHLQGHMSTSISTPCVIIHCHDHSHGCSHAHRQQSSLLSQLP